MERKHSHIASITSLRLKAEACLRELESHPTGVLSLEETQRVVHELQVYQIELELQNEALRDAVNQVEKGLEAYTDLYDFAPCSYFTIDRVGVIIQINLTGASLLQSERSRLLGRRLGVYLNESDLPVFNAMLAGVFEKKRKQSVVVKLLVQSQRQQNKSPKVKDTGEANGIPAPIFVKMDATRVPDSEHCRLVMTDITQSKHDEESLRKLTTQLFQSQNQERRRISRELHDSTAQDLAAVMMMMEMVLDSTESNPNIQQKLGDAVAMQENCIHEIRTLSYLLHPPRLDEEGLVGAIRHYATGFAERAEVKLILDLASDFPRLQEFQEMNLFRITQECLGNIHRHAHSKTVKIQLRQDKDTVLLSITDMGCGIPTKILQERSFAGIGIEDMQERMRQIGGRLEIKSTLEEGTSVHCYFSFSGEREIKRS